MSKIGVVIGNILHHYDTSLFGWVAPFLAPLLFPEKSNLEALLLTFAFLPLSYLTKPIGAIVWGWIGDQFGRTRALTMSLIGMAISTLTIGCLPLCRGAWMGVAICRVLQGFCSSGEEKGAALYLLEQTSAERRPWVSGLYDASGMVGVFLASLLASQLGQEHWRSLFFLGALAGLWGVLLRRRAKESPAFQPTPFAWRIVWRERVTLARITIVSGFSYANYFLVTVFLNGFLPTITSLTSEDILSFNTHLLWIDCFLLLGFGLLCKTVAKEKVMAAAAALTALLAVPLFMSLDGATSWGFVASIRLVFVILGVALAAPYHAWQFEILPTRHRFLIGGLGSTLGAKLFGAPIPFIATYLTWRTGTTGAAAWPLVLLGLAATATLLLTPVPLLTSPREA